MSSFFDLLRCLLCCSDEDDYYYYHDRTSHYRRNPSFQVEETEAAPSHYYTPTPRLSHLATSTSTSASFLPRYYSRDFGNSPDSPPNLSYKPPPPPPPQSTPTPPPPQYYSSNNNKPPVTSFISSYSSSKPTLSSSFNPSSSSPKKPPQPQPTSSSNSKPHPSSPKHPPHSSKPSSPKLPPVFKSILSPASSSSASNQTTYVCVEEDSLPVFIIPEDIKALIKNEIVPKVLNRPLSPTTYKDYFAALLYSEDFYLEVNNSYVNYMHKSDYHCAYLHTISNTLDLVMV